MAEYLGRTGSCTEGRFHPDTNLSAYAREHGFQTALIGAKFKGTNKLYTYWGHTGMQRGDYAKVLVPRPGSRQEETVVRIAAVVPASELKQSSGRTAKHIQSVLVGGVSPSMRIPLPGDLFTQSWRNEASFDIVPAELTEHAKSCMSEIDSVLGDKAIDFKTAPLVSADFSELELRVTAGSDAELRARGKAMHRQFEHYMVMQDITPEQFREMYQQEFAHVAPTKEDHIADMVSSYRKRYPKISDAWTLPANLSAKQIEEMCDLRYDATRTGRLIGPSNIPKFSFSGIIDHGSCGRTPTKETIMSKIENVVYVTLPGSTTRYTAESVSKEQYFTGIAALEKRIGLLENIENKPVSLQEEIDELKQQVVDLGTLCDSIYAKKTNPSLTKGVAEQADSSGTAEA